MAWSAATTAMLLALACTPAVPEPNAQSTPAALVTAPPTVRPSPPPRFTPRPTIAGAASQSPTATEAPPTMTSAQVWTTAGVRLDLPAGWSDPPGVEWLAVIAALDQLGDPPAGLYSLLWNGHTTTSGAFKFRQRPGARASAVLRVISINRNGRSVREVVDDAAADIAGGSIDVARGRKGLPFGSVRFLEWEQPIRWGSIHIRAYFFGLHDAVGRVEVGTVGVPGRSLDTELRRILESVRASRG